MSDRFTLAELEKELGEGRKSYGPVQFKCGCIAWPQKEEQYKLAACFTHAHLVSGKLRDTK